MAGIAEIVYTGYPVSNMNRAQAFYEQLLGLQKSTTFEHEGKAWIEYDIGPATLAITNMSPEWKPSTDGPAVAFEVTDFDATINRLKAAGSRFTVEPTSSPVCRLAVVCDPDGNSVAIHQRTAH